MSAPNLSGRPGNQCPNCFVCPNRICRANPVRLLVVAAGLAWAVGLAEAALADDSAPATQPVEVTAEGGVKVPMDPVTRALIGHDGQDLRVRDPSGAELAYLVTGAGVNAIARDLAVVAIDEAPDGWWIVMDAGDNPASHDGLVFEFANRAAAPGVRLEASDDRIDWQPLASGDLFRVGEAAQLQQSTLRYGPTDVRYLRLSWPKSAGYPEVRRIAALPAPAVPPPVEKVVLAPVESARAPGSVAYDLPLPGPGLPIERIELDWRGSGTAGYRLLAPDDGRWRMLGEGSLVQPAAGQPPASIELDGSPVGSPSLRLELAGGGSSDLGMQAVTAIAPRQWVVFYAPEPGRYDLDYGDLGMAPGDALTSPPPVPIAEIPEVQPGPDSARPRSDLPAAGAALGGPMPTATFAAAWNVAVDVMAEGQTASPGTVVRLELPPAVYDVARPDLGDLRLAFDPDDGGEDSQVPLIHWSSPVPILALDRPDLVPEADPKTRTSRIAVDLPEGRLPYTELELTAPARVFNRRIEVTRVDEARPGAGPLRRVVAPAANWTCAGTSVLPCRLVLDVDADRLAVPQSTAAGGDSSAGEGTAEESPGSTSRLEITFHDGDDAPMTDVDLRLWRRSDQLVFVLPDDGALSLMAGAAGLGAPDYDIQALEADLLGRPHAAARLLEGAADVVARGPMAALTEMQGRWLLLGALGVAAVALLVMLARMVRPVQATLPAGAGHDTDSEKVE